MKRFDAENGPGCRGYASYPAADVEWVSRLLTTTQRHKLVTIDDFVPLCLRGFPLFLILRCNLRLLFDSPHSSQPLPRTRFVFLPPDSDAFQEPNAILRGLDEIPRHAEKDAGQDETGGNEAN